MKSHPSLPLDTRHFPPDFTDQLLASYENLDEITDGLLIHSENWQALNLLQEKYRERVKCVYIDPPYNTEKDRADGKFLYKDGYAFSTWLAMIDGRLQVTWPLLCETGGFYVSIDDTMYADLFALLASVFGRENHIATVIWEKVHTRKNSARHFSVSHDYIPCFARDKNAWDRVLIPRENTDAYSNPDNDPRGAWKADPVYANNPYDADYTITKPNGVVLRRPPGQYWRFSEATWLEFVRRGTVIWGEGNSYPLVKRYLRDVQDGLVPVTLFKRDFAGDNAAANAEFDALFGSERLFSYPKPARLIERLCQTNVRPGAGEIVLDHFAGSGTTGHAVINLNREDGGRRKFILVEMARYFDTVLLPRIKKVTFSPEWKDGKPKRTASQEEFERGPRIVKVIRLESYEDALNNLSFDEDGAQIAMQFEDYLLRYLLQWETRKSETLLNVEKLSKPFDYCLHIHRDGEIRVQKVDLPETFAYLIGLDVAKRQVLDNDGRRYLVYRGTTREGKRTAVIWRKTEGWTENDYRRDRDFVAKHKLAEGADLIYTNGDSLIPGAQALDGVFKAKMFTSVEG
ncbi:MAG: site-specific DNA-methyltransferase [Syntrophomonadaceae bacterium]|nr:site-specific DNA-methyltransferase [Syntrophomonadaceae bacterium]